MVKTNRTHTHAFVLRIWLEDEQEGEHGWRGTILRPRQGLERHFKGADELFAYLKVAMLEEPGSSFDTGFEGSL